MFIQVNERPLNLYSVLYYYTREIIKDEVTSYGLYYRLTDGRVLEEIFESAEARDLKVEELGTATLGGLVQENTYDDFPERGSEEILYLAKDTGQMWFWDVVLEQYEKIGVSRKGGVYQYANDLPNTIGSIVEIAKSDLDVIIEPSVPFMDGSEITAHNAIRGIITKSTDTHVTVRTIADMVIDSFVQVENEESLPAKGELNVLYYLKDSKMTKTWNGDSFEFTNLGVLDGRHLALFDIAHNSTSYNDNIKYYIEHALYQDLLVIVPSDGSRVGGIFSFDSTMTSGANTNYYFKELGSSIYYRRGIDDKSKFTNLQSSSRRLAITVNTETLKYSSYDLNEHYHRTITSVLEVNKDYETPYEPQYAGSPATKKYVDDTAATLRSETTANINAAETRLNTNIENLRTETETNLQEFKDEVHTTYAIFNGDEDEYEALTQEQKNAYFLAVVNPLVTTENINLDTVEQIIVDETPTETVIDMTDEEVDESLDTIIKGGITNV